MVSSDAQLPLGDICVEILAMSHAVIIVEERGAARMMSRVLYCIDMRAAHFHHDSFRRAGAH